MEGTKFHRCSPLVKHLIFKLEFPTGAYSVSTRPKGVLIIWIDSQIARP
jgi:hypothetical protein